MSPSGNFWSRRDLAWDRVHLHSVSAEGQGWKSGFEWPLQGMPEGSIGFLCRTAGVSREHDGELKDSVCCAVSSGGRRMACFTTVKYLSHTLGEFCVWG